MKAHTSHRSNNTKKLRGLYKKTIRKRVYRTKNKALCFTEHSLTTSGNYSVSSYSFDSNMKVLRGELLIQCSKRLTHKDFNNNPKDKVLYLESSEKNNSRIPFKLYNEKDLLFESSLVSQGVQLKDHVSDFDCPTRLNQIESLIPRMDEELSEALSKYKNDREVVINVKKYGRK